jgi:hypothetical protein
MKNINIKYENKYININMEIFMKMEVSNEYLVGNWTISSSITNSLSAVGYRARIYLMSTNGKNESIDLSSYEVTPKNPAHKNIHIHKPPIVACLESHIMYT